MWKLLSVWVVYSGIGSGGVGGWFIQLGYTTKCAVACVCVMLKFTPSF